MNQYLKLLAPVTLMMFVLVACGGGGGASGGGSGNVPTGNPSVVAKVSSPAPLAQCPTGGITVDTGIDANLNGLLDPGEVDLTQYVCDGATALVSIVSEPSGTNCTAGGSKVSSGPDTNGSGTLDSGEVTSTDYICKAANGSNGSDGSNGANSLLSITTEPTGTNCPTGGLKVLSWLDTTANGSVDSEETTFTNYICNAPGTVVIQSISADPAVVRPGADASLRVSATDGVGSPLTYQWSGPGGFGLATSATTTWTAPSIAGSYLVDVLVSNGSSTVTGYASVLVSAAPTGPVVTSVSPQSARAGDEVLITGAGFGAAKGSSTVAIGGVAAATINSWSEYEIRALVPSGAVTGSVVVTVGGAASSPGSIEVPWAAGITTATNVQTGPQAVSDGAGGAIIVWEDYRNSAYTDIYVQRVNSAGAPLWTANGVAVCTFSMTQGAVQIVADGAGGAIIVWQDDRYGTLDTQIYAQRISSTGAVLWTANGLAISLAADRQTLPQILADGSGGAIIAWQDARSTTSYDVYAQRVSGAGVVQWTADGIAVTSGVGNNSDAKLATDGSGGAILAWHGDRSGSYDIYAQRVNSAGTAQWTVNGVAISAAAGNQFLPQLVQDGANGAIIAWQDLRSSAGQTYAQRVNSSGVAQWTADGVAISATAYDQSSQQIVSDGAGGAIIAWADTRNTLPDIYAQRVNSSGAVQWTANGVAVCSASESQYILRLIADGSGGAIIAWTDNRSATNNDVYAQRISGAGTPYWTTNGIAVAALAGEQVGPRLVSDGSGGALIIWEDNRNGNSDIYGQHIGFDGVL